jgi:hypothetical protein
LFIIIDVKYLNGWVNMLDFVAAILLTASINPACTQELKPAVNSKIDLPINEDGSINLYFGPTALPQCEKAGSSRPYSYGLQAGYIHF